MRSVIGVLPFIKSWREVVRPLAAEPSGMDREARQEVTIGRAHSGGCTLSLYGMPWLGTGIAPHGRQ
ncbi:MAG: hypothetical protein C0457_00910 [Polymorphum sp.]|nr:hypothetical protein [Polymorphum sp.]